MALTVMKPRRWVTRLGGAALLVVAVVATSCVVHKIGGNFSSSPGESRKSLSPEAQRIITRALAGLPDSAFADYHVHLLGLGSGGSGAYVHPEMKSWLHPIQRIKFAVYKSAAGIRDERDADLQYIERLTALADQFGAQGVFSLYAFDWAYRPDGTVDKNRSAFHVPNEYAFKAAEARPDLFEPVMSVHPYRKDAPAALDRWAARGGRMVKWLPNAMGIDPADPRCDPFYERMRQHGLVLLSHAGEEQSVEQGIQQLWGNPLRLRRALDHGVRVVVLHCASLGEGRDLDLPGHPKVPNVDLFLRLMETPKYEGLVFGEISGVTQYNRMGSALSVLLRRTDLHDRLVNGSDYPLPAINVLIRTSKLRAEGFITAAERRALNEIYAHNPLLFDMAVKRTVRDPETGRQFSAAIFGRHPDVP